jgi:hypothetical protein
MNNQLDRGCVKQWRACLPITLLLAVNCCALQNRCYTCEFLHFTRFDEAVAETGLKLACFISPPTTSCTPHARDRASSSRHLLQDVTSGSGWCCRAGGQIASMCDRATDTAQVSSRHNTKDE